MKASVLKSLVGLLATLAFTMNGVSQTADFTASSEDEILAANFSADLDDIHVSGGEMERIKVVFHFNQETNDVRVSAPREGWVSVLNSHGNTIFNPIGLTENNEINLGDLKEGTYTLKVQDANGYKHYESFRKL